MTIATPRHQPGPRSISLAPLRISEREINSLGPLSDGVLRRRTLDATGSHQTYCKAPTLAKLSAVTLFRVIVQCSCFSFCYPLSVFGRSFPSENMPFPIPWFVIHAEICLTSSSRRTQWQGSSYSFTQLSSSSNASYHSPTASRGASGRPCGAHSPSILHLHHL